MRRRGRKSHKEFNVNQQCGSTEFSSPETDGAYVRWDVYRAVGRPYYHRSLPLEPMASTWLILDKDGDHLGESQAMSAKVAFILYMSEKGVSLGLTEVLAEKLPDGDTRIVHRGKPHFLRRVSKSGKDR